jgi:aminoglycoside N3'-acetyltransferase
MFSEFGQIINGTSLSAWGELEKAFINTQMITQLTNMIMDKLLKPGNVLDFGGMVKNTSVVTALFNSVRINSESMNGLFSGYLRSDKVKVQRFN